MSPDGSLVTKSSRSCSANNYLVLISHGWVRLYPFFPSLLTRRYMRAERMVKFIHGPPLICCLLLPGFLALPSQEHRIFQGCQVGGDLSAYMYAGYRATKSQECLRLRQILLSYENA